MKSSDFMAKLLGRYLWGNLTAMLVVVLLLGVGVKLGLDLYTHHGEAIVIPDLRHKLFSDAERIMDDAGLTVVVTDTGYVKTLPPDCILSQSPEAGERVKTGHLIYVTINSPHTPTITLPDIIDNSSLREAMAKLSAMGFRLAQPQRVPGEKDWVYGVTVRGRSVVAGDKIAIDEAVVIQAGNGLRDEEDSVRFIDPVTDDGVFDNGETDEFEVVTAPPAGE